MDVLKRSHHFLDILSKNTSEMEAYNKQKKDNHMKQKIRGVSQPISSMMEDLTSSGINYKIPKQKTQKGSSLPSRLVIKEPDGATGSIKNIKIKTGEPVRDFKREIKSKNMVVKDQTQKVMHLAKSTSM